ncbi:MAG: class I SAM-dependent methyltransferase [Desulfobacterales bacterium]
MYKKIYYKLCQRRHFTQALKQLKKMETKLLSPEARFALPFVYRGKGFYKTIEPRQNPIEIENLYRKVLNLRPKRVLEIGTARGGTLYLWIQAALSDATIISVDLPDGNFGGAYPEEKVPFYSAFARESQKLHLLRKDSHDIKTVEEVKRLLNGKLLDFAFIDGDHTYEGVKKDFAHYAPLVRPGGIIGFHDILPRPDMPSIQVDRFWSELKEKYCTEEIIGNLDSGRKIGIGVLMVGNNETNA